MSFKSNKQELQDVFSMGEMLSSLKIFFNNCDDNKKKTDKLLYYESPIVHFIHKYDKEYQSRIIDAFNRADSDNQRVDKEWEIIYNHITTLIYIKNRGLTPTKKWCD